jgi:succinate-acetate transporter protein
MPKLEAQMHNTAVCPYFDHNEDACDVGCGYITSHDASMIIKFCSSRYQSCHKYRELTERLQDAELLDQKASSVAARPDRNFDKLPVLGLCSYSVTIAAYALDKLEAVTVNLHVLAIILMLGSIGQISAGLKALKNSPLRAIAFTSFGLFWLSILALDILPRAGYGSTPGSISMMIYFAVWGMFCLILTQGGEHLTRPCRTVFAMMTAFLLIFALAHALQINAFLRGAALIGLTSSLPGFFYGMRYLSSETVELLQTHAVKSGKMRS